MASGAAGYARSGVVLAHFGPLQYAGIRITNLSVRHWFCVGDCAVNCTKLRWGPLGSRSIFVYTRGHEVKSSC